MERWLLGSNKVKLCEAAAAMVARGHQGAEQRRVLSRSAPNGYHPTGFIQRSLCEGREELRERGLVTAFHTDGPWEPKTIFITFCLSFRRMAGPGKARVTINFPFQDAIQKRRFSFLGPWLSVRNSILAFKIKPRLPKCKFNLMANF